MIINHQSCAGSIIAIFALVTVQASGANLVENGDFDDVGKVFKVNTPQGGDDIQTAGGSKIPGWTNVAKLTNELWVGSTNDYDLKASPGNGSGYFVDLTGQANAKPYGGIAQKIVTEPGKGYTLTFSLGASTLYNSSGSGEAALTASATGSAELASHLFSLNPTSASDWKTETLTFVADSDSTTIEFLADSKNTSQYTGLDDVVLEARLLGTSTQLTVSPTTAKSDATISMTAIVKPTEGSVTPTGKVEFKSGSTVLHSVTLNGTGQASFCTSALSVGKHSISSVYGGDSTHSTSTSQTVTVTIGGSAAGLTFSPSTLAFGNQASGRTSTAKSVTIKNTGTTTVSISSITLAGSQADDFSFKKACGSSLAATASCTVSVTFKPVSTGTKAAKLTFADSAAGTPQTMALSGTGTSASTSATLGLIF